MSHLIKPVGGEQRGVVSRESLQKEGFEVASAYYPRADLVLPEPRFVQTGVDVKEVEGRRYEVPIVEDRWDAVHDQKLKTFQELTSSVVNAHCTAWVATMNCNKARVEDKCKTVKSGMGENMEFNSVCERIVKGTYNYFDVHYTDVENIHQDTPFLGIGDPWVRFKVSGKEYELLFSSEEEAVRAAGLLEDLRFINRAMFK